MPDDVITPDEEQDDLTPVVHDDIMKRLLDYQRRLREDSPSEPSHPLVDYSAMEAQAAMATATEEIVDLTEIEEPEAEIEVIEVVEVGEADEVDEVEPVDANAAAAPTGEPTKVEEPSPAEGSLAERVEQLEASLDQIATMLAAMRSDFQDLAIRADERIAEIEDALASARGRAPRAG